MVTQITPINLIPGTMIPRVNISQYDTGARVLKFQVYNGDSLFTFTNAMSVALVGTKPDGKGFSYTGTIASNMPTFDVTAQMSAVAGKVRAELVVFESGKRCGSGNFVIFVEEGALGDGTDMSDSDYAIINDALEAAFDLDHFYADLQNMVTEAVEDIQVQQGQTVIDPTLTVSGAAADAKATGDMARKFLEALMTETVGPAAIVTTDDAAGGLPLKKLTANIEPTQSGTGDPSPDNVRPISGYDSLTVTRTGKNLLTNNMQSVTKNGITMTRNTDGSFTFNGTATASIGFYISAANSSTQTVLPIKPGTYTLSGGASGGTGTTFRLAVYIYVNGTYTRAYSDFGSSRTFTISEDENGYIPLINIYNGTTVSNLTFKPQLEIGDTATEYEPYNGATYPITFPTAAGTVYGGTLTVNSDGSGTLTIDKAMQALDGDSNVGKSSRTSVDEYLLRVSGDKIGIGGTYYDAEHIICSHAVNISADDPNVIHTRQTGSQPRIVFPLTYGMSDLTAFKTWLAEQRTNGTPLQFCYMLATPTTYALSAVQVAELLQGVNNLWTDAAGTLSAEYYANTALYVEKKIAELQALILEN